MSGPKPKTVCRSDSFYGPRFRPLLNVRCVAPSASCPLPNLFSTAFSLNPCFVFHGNTFPGYSDTKIDKFQYYATHSTIFLQVIFYPNYSAKYKALIINKIKIDYALGRIINLE